MTWSNSLLDAGDGRPVYEAIDWVNIVLLGQLAVGLCVIAVAVIGILMLGGRWPVLQGMRTLLGCFLLLVAPVMVAEFIGQIEPRHRGFVLSPVGMESVPPRDELPPADYNPYASATMRTD